MRMKNALRSSLPSIIARLPSFRGRGRLVLLVDSLLTDPDSPQSYLAVGIVNAACRLQLDLRGWSQKFAYYYRELEREHVNTLRDLYQGGIFVDVGSSIGLYSVCLAHKVRTRHGRIAAFEPVPFNLARQQVNFGLNGITDLVDVYPIALGPVPTTLRMRCDPSHADNNAFITPAGDLEVQVARLDDIATQWPRIGAIKIDIEGYEPEMLKGARATIDRDRPAILAEFNRERMKINGLEMHETWQWFKAHDYDFYRIAGGKLEQLSSPADHENLFLLPREGER